MPAQKSSTQMMELKSPFESELSENRVVVKGFASVEVVDRHNEIVSPLDFNIPTFMQSRSLLVNHRPLIDPYGNVSTAGQVKVVTPAYIGGEDGDDWLIFDLRAKTQIDRYPKSKIPELGMGVRGLWVVAESDRPEVVQRVQKGELNTFSWKGLATKVQRFEDNQIVSRWLNVDLHEISLMDTPPANRHSTFMVMKGAGDEDIFLSQIHFPKEKYSTTASVESYLRDHSFDWSNLRDEGNFVCAFQETSDRFDVRKSVRVPMDDAFFILSPRRQDPQKQVVSKQQNGGSMKINSIDPSSLAPLFGSMDTSTEKLTLADGSQLEVQQVVLKELKAPESPPVDPAKDQATADANKAEIQRLIAEQFAALESKLDIKAIAEKLNAFDESLKTMSTRLDEMKPGEKKEGEVDVSEQLEAVKGLFSQLVESQGNQSKQIQELASAFAIVAKSGVSKGLERTDGGSAPPADPKRNWFGQFFQG